MIDHIIKFHYPKLDKPSGRHRQCNSCKSTVHISQFGGPVAFIENIIQEIELQNDI